MLSGRLCVEWDIEGAGEQGNGVMVDIQAWLWMAGGSAETGATAVGWSVSCDALVCCFSSVKEAEG